MKFNSLVLGGAIALAGLVPKAYSQEDVPPAAPSEASENAAKDWRFMLSPVTAHFHPDNDHRYVYMVGLERQYPSGVILGATYFQNSFGQPSGYVFGGYRFRHLGGYEPLFAEATAGIIYGYVAPFDHKVPFDVNGFAPAAVVSLGWQFTPIISAQVNLLGLSAVMLQFSLDF